MKKILVHIRNYFGFSKTENRAMLILMPLSIAIVLFHGVINNRLLYKEHDSSSDKKMLDSLHSIILSSLSDSTQNDKTSKRRTETRKTVKKKKKTELYDINLADTVMLKKVYGVGSKLSQRIIKYREYLGGYVSMNQLYEVYYLDSQVVDRVRQKFSVKKNFIPLQTNLNTSTLEIIAKHPYLSFNEARLIINYRNQHGPFQSPDDLINIPVFNHDKIVKIKPYFRVED